MRWDAWHLHYHADLDALLARGVAPLLRELLAEGLIDRFFFVRSMLGGPHLRLRLRRRGEADGAAEDPAGRRVERAARDFFARYPSRRTLDEAKIRQINANVLAHDANEDDDAIYPDNRLRAAVFTPETERYGGERLLPLSLTMFCASSLAAIAAVAGFREADRSRRLAEAFRVLAAQAWGHAASRDDFLSLLAWVPPAARRAMAAIETRADRVFARQAETFRGLLREALARAAATGDDPDAGAPELAAAAAARLRHDLDRVSESRPERPDVRRIVTSHLHMTANRLGLHNAEEVYLCRLLEKSAARLRSDDPDFWRLIGASFSTTPAVAGSLDRWLAARLDRFQHQEIPR